MFSSSGLETSSCVHTVKKNTHMKSTTWRLTWWAPIHSINKFKLGIWNLTGIVLLPNDFTTFSHDTCELPRDVSLWDGRGRGVSVTGRWVMRLIALWHRIFICSRFRAFWRRGHRLYGRLSSSGSDVSLNGCDDDLLKLLKGITKVSSFQNILAKDKTFLPMKNST